MFLGGQTLTLNYWVRGTRKSNQFCMVIKLDVKKKFTGSVTPPGSAKKFLLTRRLTRNLFGVAKLLIDISPSYHETLFHQTDSIKTEGEKKKLN